MPRTSLDNVEAGLAAPACAASACQRPRKRRPRDVGCSGDAPLPCSCATLPVQELKALIDSGNADSDDRFFEVLREQLILVNRCFEQEANRVRRKLKKFLVLQKVLPFLRTPAAKVLHADTHGTLSYALGNAAALKALLRHYDKARGSVLGREFMQLCWEAHNLSMGAVLHSPFLEELRAAELVLQAICCPDRSNSSLVQDHVGDAEEAHDVQGGQVGRNRVLSLSDLDWSTHWRRSYNPNALEQPSQGAATQRLGETTAAAREASAAAADESGAAARHESVAAADVQGHGTPGPASAQLHGPSGQGNGDAPDRRRLSHDGDQGAGDGGHAGAAGGGRPSSACGREAGVGEAPERVPHLQPQGPTQAPGMPAAGDGAAAAAGLAATGDGAATAAGVATDPASPQTSAASLDWSPAAGAVALSPHAPAQIQPTCSGGESSPTAGLAGDDTGCSRSSSPARGGAGPGLMSTPARGGGGHGRTSNPLRLTCSVCLSPLFNPVGLPCGHVYCNPCVLRMMGLHQVAVSVLTSRHIVPESAACPECRQRGVFRGAVRLPAMGALSKTMHPADWKQRSKEEAERVKVVYRAIDLASRAADRTQLLQQLQRWKSLR